MSVDFSNNGATDWYEAAGTITLPDADWAVGVWVKMDEVLLGTAFRYVLSNNGVTAFNSLNLFFDEDDAGGPENVICRLRDGINPRIDGLSLAGMADSAEETLYVVQRRAGVKEFYGVRKGGTATVVTNNNALGEISSPNLWNIGRRQDGNVDRYFQNIAGEVWVILNDSLTQDQIESLAQGTETILNKGFSPEAYWRMRSRSDIADVSGNGHTLTKHGNPKDSSIIFLGPRPPISDTRDGGEGTQRVVDIRRRERAEEEGRRERERFRRELRAIVERALRQAADDAPPDRAVEQAVGRELTRRGLGFKVRDIAAMIAAMRKRRTRQV